MNDITCSLARFRLQYDLAHVSLHSYLQLLFYHGVIELASFSP